MDSSGSPTGIRAFALTGERYRWTRVDVTTYSASGTQSQGMSKHVLFGASPGLPVEVRYFEAEPGGYSALERHQHVHEVLILRGRGSVMVDGRIDRIAAHDAIYIPPNTWHQFYADPDEYLGFICIVSAERDRPARPSTEEIRELEQNSSPRNGLRY